MSAVTHDPPLLDHPGGRLHAWQALGRAIAAVPAWPEAIGGTPPVPRQVTKKPVTPKPGATGFDLLVHLFVGHDADDALHWPSGSDRPRSPTSRQQGSSERSGTEVVSKFGIERWAGVAVLHDWPEWRDASDYVMGLTNAGRSLRVVHAAGADEKGARPRNRLGHPGALCCAPRRRRSWRSTSTRER